MKRQTPKCLWHAQRGGFTLIELMISVAIIAILAAFLAPSVSTFMRRSQGKAAARDVANTFRMAHNQAMSRGEVILADITAHNGTDADNNQVSGGQIRLYRTTDNNIAECNPDNANFDPANTDCYAMSCAQAQAFDREAVHTLDLSKSSPDMKISGMDPAANNQMVCFSPNGRILDMSGLPLESDDDNCDATNLRVFVRSLEDNADVIDSLGDTALDACVSVVGADGGINANLASTRQEQKNKRDIANFYSIHLPYNGSISVTQ